MNSMNFTCMEIIFELTYSSRFSRLKNLAINKRKEDVELLPLPVPQVEAFALPDSSERSNTKAHADMRKDLLIHNYIFSSCI